MTKPYVGMYIINPSLDDEAIKAAIEEVSKIFSDNASAVKDVDEWGMRDLAYEINDFKKGYYVKFTVDATKEAVNEFDRVLNIKSETYIRHILCNE